MYLCVWNQEMALSCTFTLTGHFHTCATEVRRLVGCPSSTTSFSASRETQHRSPSNNSSNLLSALPYSVLTLSNSSFSLKLWWMSTALTNPQERWAVLAVCKPLLHLCLFCESAHNSWEPLWRNHLAALSCVAEVRMLSCLENGIYPFKTHCDGEDGNISLGSRWLFQEDILGMFSGFAFHVVYVHTGSWFRLNKG